VPDTEPGGPSCQQKRQVGSGKEALLRWETAAGIVMAAKWEEEVLSALAAAEDLV
jgi:hypothetical protein